MCRLYAFRTSLRSTVHRSLLAAENALAEQSRRHPDGWGIGYYVDEYPHLYRNAKQALDDGLFGELGSIVSTNTFLGHIRQANVGPVSLLNCHPFQFGKWLFAHNGQIAGYNDDPQVRDRVRALVAPRFHRNILGDTDSEVFFFAFLTRLCSQFEDIHLPGLPFEPAAEALRRTVADIVAISDTSGDIETKLTCIATNGNLMIGHRFRVGLHFSTHKSECPEKDSCALFKAHMCESPVADGIVRHLILTSEAVAPEPNVWNELGDGETVGVDWGMHFRRLPAEAPVQVRSGEAPCASTT